MRSKRTLSVAASRTSSAPSLTSLLRRRKGGGILLFFVLLIAGAFGIRLWHDHLQPLGPPADLMEAERRARERPDDFQAQLDWGGLLLKSGRLDESAQVFSHVSQLHPQDARPYVW